MSDPNLSDFYGRVARIQKDRTKGRGFEAPGTLGRSYYYQPAPRRRSLLGPALFLLISVFLLKGMIYHSVGADSYAERVAALQAGEGVERVGGWLMQPEAVTIMVADRISWLLTQIR